MMEKSFKWRPIIFYSFYCNKMRIDTLPLGLSYSSTVHRHSRSVGQGLLVIQLDILFEIYSLSLSGNRANDNMVTFSSGVFVNNVIFRALSAVFTLHQLDFPAFCTFPAFFAFPAFFTFPAIGVPWTRKLALTWRERGLSSCDEILHLNSNHFSRRAGPNSQEN